MHSRVTKVACDKGDLVVVGVGLVENCFISPLSSSLAPEDSLKHLCHESIHSGHYPSATQLHLCDVRGASFSQNAVLAYHPILVGISVTSTAAA